MPKMTRDEWLALSDEEKASLRADRISAAHDAVGTGEFPKAVRIKLGNHTLFLKPSGVSDKGNVSYNYPKLTLEVGGRGIRINSMNVTVLSGETQTDDDIEAGEVIG